MRYISSILHIHDLRKWVTPFISQSLLISYSNKSVNHYRSPKLIITIYISFLVTPVIHTEPLSKAHAVTFYFVIHLYAIGSFEKCLYVCVIIYYQLKLSIFYSYSIIITLYSLKSMIFFIQLNKKFFTYFDTASSGTIVKNTNFKSNIGKYVQLLVCYTNAIIHTQRLELELCFKIVYAIITNNYVRNQIFEIILIYLFSLIFFELLFLIIILEPIIIL